ncbi:MAG: cobalt ECF transporter T component CbiQ [Actinomycetota bacterium]
MSRIAIDDAAWNSTWRQRSVAEKSVLAGGLLVVALTSTTLAVDAAVVALSCAALLGPARVAPRLVLHALRGPASFIVIGLVAMVVSVGSPKPQATWSWGVFSINEAAPELAIEVAGRSFAALSALLILALTTPISDVLGGLRRVGMPAAFVEVGVVMYRLLFLLLDAQAAIRESQSARLGYARREVALRSIAGLFSAVLRRSWTHAQRLTDGLVGRGYTGHLHVTTPSHPISLQFVLSSGALIAVLLLGPAVAR